jgi:murein DD-endopeptidase MepM/ murein hydrolase activator NlpD
MRLPALPQLAGAAFLLMLIAACRPLGHAAPPSPLPPVTAGAPATPVTIMTATSSPAPTPPPPATPTPLPTTTPLPAATATSTAAASPVAAATTTAAPIPPVAHTAPPIERACPNPAPARPVYRHYSLAGVPWPTPVSLPAADRPRLPLPLLTDGLPRLNEQYPYGYDGGGRYLLHNGLDFVEPRGTPLLAVAEGTVVVAQADAGERFGWRCDWYGHLVVLELDQTWQGRAIYVLYGHVLNIVVEAGQRVRPGDVLADLGVGGATVGAHLHLEVRLGSNEFGATRNPYLWLEPAPGRGVIAGRLLDGAGRPWQGVHITAAGESENGISRATWSYLVDPLPLVNPDDILAENFVLAGLPSGPYRLTATIQGITYTVPVEVVAGQISTVEIVADP